MFSQSHLSIEKKPAGCRHRVLQSPLRLVCFLISAILSLSAQGADRLPNILFILADDLGYGDVGCYNPDSKIPTPNLDRLAAEGMRFTDAHSPSTVCTPSRYSVLTGRMAFRTGMKGVFTGVDGPCLIEEGRLTLPQMLRNKGYATACVGKWHVGMTFLDMEGHPVKKGAVEGVRQVDFTRSMPDAPVHRGFDSFFGTVSCPTTDWLYAYIEDDSVPVPPKELIDQKKFPSHAYSRGFRAGLIADNFDPEEVDLVFLEKSKSFLKEHVANSPEKPFFLYHSMQAVHLPSLPAKEFQGKTGMGPHADFIVELDHVVGELMNTLDRLGVADDTIIMFASDNGPEVPVVLEMRRTNNHDPAKPWRGMKRDQWEGGHRTPFIVRWPGKVPAGSTSNQMTSLTDVMATCAAVVGTSLPENSAEDSYDILPVMLGTQGDRPVRKYMLQQTPQLLLSIREGNWKYLDHQGSGGNNYERGPLQPLQLKENDPEAPGQLYNLEDDPGETSNLYSQRPEIVERLKARLEEFKGAGRSAPLMR